MRIYQRSMTVKSLVKNTKYWTGGVMGRHKLLFQFLPLSKRNQWKKVSAQKDICIEGFPRSANSFFSSVFRAYNPTAKCAHHMHAPMQVMKAIEYDIPCIVLIRKPIDAIASVLVVDRALSIRLAIQSYIHFYERVLPVRKSIVIADFKDATQRPQQIVETLNQRYGTLFHMEPIAHTVRSRIFGQLQNDQKELNLPKHLVAIPTEAKARIKQDVLPELSKHPLLPVANTLYQKILEV